MKIVKDLKSQINALMDQAQKAESEIEKLTSYLDIINAKISEKEDELSDLDGVFGRKVKITDEYGEEIEAVALFGGHEGEVVTRLRGLEGKSIYPIGSDFSVAYEHPEGIIISIADAEQLEVNME